METFLAEPENSLLIGRQHAHNEVIESLIKLNGSARPPFEG
jgi:hypothetical protein